MKKARVIAYNDSTKVRMSKRRTSKKFDGLYEAVSYANKNGICITEYVVRH